MNTESQADLLDEYCYWFLTSCNPVGWIPFENPIWQIENITSVLMHREGQFQIQMFIVPPHTIVPEHTHPNVDSYEIYGGGEIRFSHSGKLLSADDECKKDPASPMGLSTLHRTIVRVKPNDIHGGFTGENGGVFFSVQHWLNGVKPHCVAADYIGKTMGEHHLESVKYGDAYFDGCLSKKDAASKEKSALT